MPVSCFTSFKVCFIISIFRLFSSVVKSSGEAKPILLPLQPVAITNSPLFLFCYSDGDATGYQWTRIDTEDENIGSCFTSSGHGYSPGENYGIVVCNITESRFKIEAVNSTDLHTNWRCTVTYSNGNIHSNTVTLYQKKDLEPLIIVASVGNHFLDNNTATVNESDTLTTTCTTTPAYPDPLIQWYISLDADDSTAYIELHDFENVTSDRGPDGTVRVNSTLVYNLTREDNGKHIFCNASNNYSSNSSPSLGLDVQYEANVKVFALNNTTSPVNSTVDAIRGSSISFLCEVDSNPTAEITLTRATTPLTMIDSGSILMFTKQNISLDDGGVYTCSARNPVFNTETNEKLNVTIVYGAKVTDFLLNNERYQGNATLNDTESLNVTCTVESKPAADVHIKAKNAKCQPTQFGYSKCEVDSTTCVEHAGLYTCHANNSLSSDSRSIPVFINCINITTHSDVFVPDGVNETVTLSAIITAYPAPYVFWTLPNSSITFGACHNKTDTIYYTILVCNLTVKITNENEFGNYSLAASNVRGNTSRSFIIVHPSEETTNSGSQPVTPGEDVNIALVAGSAAGGLVVIIVFGIVAVHFLRKGKSGKGGGHEESAVYGSQEMNSIVETNEDNGFNNLTYATGESRTAQNDQSNADALYAKVDKCKKKDNKDTNTREGQTKTKPPDKPKKPKGGNGAASQQTDGLTYIQVDFRPGDKKQKGYQITTPVDMGSTPYADIDYSKQVHPFRDEKDRRVESVRRQVPDPIDQSVPPARPSKPASLSTSVGQRPGKGRGKTEQHSLNYAEVSFSKQPPRPKRSAAVRQEETTPYADIAFNKRGAPPPPDQSDQ